MKKLIILLLAMSSLSAFANDDSCRPGYSLARMEGVYAKSHLIDYRVSETRGDQLSYTLYVTLTSAKMPGAISGANSVFLEATFPEVGRALAELQGLGQDIQHKNVSTLCVKRYSGTTPENFDLDFGGTYSIDTE